MCDTDVIVEVPFTRFDGSRAWVDRRVDACIAPLVAALNAGGVHTSRSCCGHGRTDGEINLHDGRSLIVRQLVETAANG